MRVMSLRCAHVPAHCSCAVLCCAVTYCLQALTASPSRGVWAPAQPTFILPTCLTLHPRPPTACQVGPPKVITKRDEATGDRLEPMEEAVVEVR